ASLIYHRAARRVYEVAARLHHAKSLFIKQMMRGRGPFPGANERHMDAHVVGLRQAFFEAGIADAGLLALQSALVGKIHELLDLFYKVVGLINRIVAEHVHGKAARLVHQGLADASGANDGQDFAGDLVAQEWQEWM